MNETERVRMEETKQSPASFSCSDCHQLFLSLPELTLHTNTHCENSPNKPVRCEICSTICTDHSSLLYHMENTYHCELCGISHHTPEQLTHHTEVVHASRTTHACDLCQKTFAHRPSLLRHRKTHTIDSKEDEVRTHPCDLCSKSYAHYNSLERHKKDAHKSPSKMKVCKVPGEIEEGHESGTRTAKRQIPRDLKSGSGGCGVCRWLMKEWLEHVGESELYSCDSCQLDYSNTAELITHIEQVHQVKIIVRHQLIPCLHRSDDDAEVWLDADAVNCRICGKAFMVGSQLTQHMQIMHSGDDDDQGAAEHGDTETATSDVEPTSNSYQCTQCEKSFSFKSVLTSHMKAHKKRSEKRTYSCDTCSKAFVHYQSLDRHKRETHQNPGKYSKKRGSTYECKLCAKTFNHYQSLDRHKRDEHPASPLTCSVCSVTRRTKSLLRKHWLTHAERRRREESQHMCESCGKIFGTKTHLKSHVSRVHMKEKPLQCHICVYRCHDRSNLNSHIRTHTGEKPYRCSHCGKSYTQNNKLVDHIRLVHTGERLVQCQVCAKRLPNAHLKRHMMRHRGEKPYSCKYCAKTFSSSGERKCHERIHTGEKPFSCKVCGRRFTKSSHVTQHMKTHRSDDASSSVQQYQLPPILPPAAAASTVQMQFPGMGQEWPAYPPIYHSYAPP